MSDTERMARLEERLRQVADEHPICREQLHKATEEIKDIRERLSRVEKGHEALERAVFDMKADIREQLGEFKKFVLWTIGTGITVSGIVVSAVQLILGK